jgi:hypothetical protein
MYRSRAMCALALLELVACRSVPQSAASTSRYLVTVRPIDVGLPSAPLCIAVDPVDEHGVWWWDPGASGCDSRSTGPGVFWAEEAVVTRSAPSGPIAASFRLPTHSASRPVLDVRLVIEAGQMRTLGSAVKVELRGRSTLDLPEMPPKGRRAG